VETEAELATLRAVGVDKAQGYFLARPCSWDDFQARALPLAVSRRARG